MSGPIAYEDFIPTDKWSLQDWYLLKMVKIENIYTVLLRAQFSRAIDQRALVNFFAEVKGYRAFAFENFKKHLSGKEFTQMDALLVVSKEGLDADNVEPLMDLLNKFHWNSGLSKLSESRPMGPFAYARKQRGLMNGGADEHNDS